MCIDMVLRLLHRVCFKFWFYHTELAISHSYVDLLKVIKCQFIVRHCRKKSTIQLTIFLAKANDINNRTNKRTGNILVVDLGCLACKKQQNIKEGCCWYIIKYSEFLKAIGTMLLIIRKYATAWNYMNRQVTSTISTCMDHLQIVVYIRVVLVNMAKFFFVKFLCAHVLNCSFTWKNTNAKILAQSD